MDIEDAISDAMRASQRMKSAEADFTKSTWTFTAPYFEVSGGEYVVLTKTAWDTFVANIRRAVQVKAE